MDINNSIVISNLLSENRKLEEEVKKLRDEKKELINQSKLIEIKKARKPFFSSSRSSKTRLRSGIKKTLVSLNKKLKSANLTVKNIKVVEENNKNYENECDFVEISPVFESDLSKEKMSLVGSGGQMMSFVSYLMRNHFFSFLLCILFSSP